MFDTMKTAAPIGRILGIELEEVAALTALLGSAGIKGTEAGTALKNSFLRLSAATPKTVKMLKAINVSVDDGTGNMRKFTDILADVGAATKEFGTLKTAKVFNELFGKRAIAGASNLATNISELRDFEKMLKGAGKTSELTAEIMRTSLENKLKTLGSAATEFGFKILSAFRGDAKGGLDGMTESIRKMNVTGFVEELKVVVKFMGLLLTAASGVATAFDKIGTFLGVTAAKVVTAGIFETVGGKGFSLDEAFGGGGGKEAPQRVGPNQAEAAAKTFPGFQGQLNIAGAPEGSTLETSKPGPPGFSVAMLGQN
jgi:hypothetical protein